MSYVQNETIRALRERKALTQKPAASPSLLGSATTAPSWSSCIHEQDITVRFKKRGHGTVYAYCNRDGLFSRRL